jgi:hypothetical protein
LSYEDVTNGWLQSMTQNTDVTFCLLTRKAQQRGFFVRRSLFSFLHSFSLKKQPSLLKPVGMDEHASQKRCLFRSNVVSEIHGDEIWIVFTGCNHWSPKPARMYLDMRTCRCFGILAFLSHPSCPRLAHRGAFWETPQNHTVAWHHRFSLWRCTHAAKRSHGRASQAKKERGLLPVLVPVTRDI